MIQMDEAAIRELSQMMKTRGVPYQTGRLISLSVLRNTRQMISWLEENPEATNIEMLRKAKEIGKRS